MPQFQSFNFRDRFIRHRSFEGVLSRKQDGGPDANFSFVVVDRGAGRISLRSENFPDRFLRHRDFRIMLEKSAGPADQLFRQDSTFFLEPGLAAANGVSFRSFTSRTVFSVTATSDCSLTHGTARISPPMQHFSGYSSSITAPTSTPTLSTISADDVHQFDGS